MQTSLLSNASLPSKDQEDQSLKKSPWIHAWSDNVAGIKAHSQMMQLVDLKDDGDYKLVIADIKGNIKVYMGTNVIYNESINDKITAIEFIYNSTKKPMRPLIAIARANSIYYYEQLQPHLRFDLPVIKFSEQEEQIWKNLGESEENQIQALCDELFQLREQGTQLSTISTELLSFESMQEQIVFIKQNLQKKIQHQNFVTCLLKISKNIDEEKTIQYLIVGTENKEILFLDQTCMNVKKTIILKSVPVQIQVQGLFDQEHKIFISCRDGNVYFIRNGVLQETVFNIESKPVGMVQLEKTIVIAGMNQQLYSFYYKGKRNFTLGIPSQITAICKFELKRNQTIQAVIVSLINGEIRMYNDKHLVCQFKNDEVVHGMCFGVFGREEGCLILNYKNGGLSAKILQRQANLQKAISKPGPPPEQDIPLNIPKKTKLFVELQQREKEQSIKIHTTFQKDLCKMRLKIASTFINILTQGNAPMSYTQGSQIRLTANYEGIGPVFKIKLQLQNLSKKPIINTQIVLTFNQNIYKLRNRNPFLPSMIPNLVYKVDVEVENIDATGSSDLIKVFVFNKESTIPMITANLSMPISEQNFDNF